MIWTILPLAFACSIQTSWSYIIDYNGFIIQQITKPVQHAEGPHWLQSERALYYVDIAGFGIHRYEMFTRRHTFITLNDTVSVIVPISGNKGEFVIGYGKNISILSWNGRSENYTTEDKFKVDDDKVGNRFNDGKADAKGRLWIGTMGEEKPVGTVKLDQGSLFRVSTNCILDNELNPVSISNGLAWNSQNTKMYYIDTSTRKIDVFDYNICTGTFSNRQTFFDFAINNITGSPDGMTIDDDENLWIAVWGGGKVIQVSQTGRLLLSVRIPADRVTSVAWGGINYDTLFVTTMRLGLTQDELKSQPAAGAVFEVIGLPTRGRKANSVSACFLDLPNLS